MSGSEDAKLAGLKKECQQLEEQISAQHRELNLLRVRFARYETALRVSHVAVCTQDQDLRYTSISSPILGRSIEDTLGCTDDEILPPDAGANVSAMKREVLANGQPKRVEFALADGPGARWQDVHVEPLRDDAGSIIGLICASIDVTERKESEAHLRLLLRELTHRSKNLLAVIQAMARQTARHVGSVEGFLDQFGSRLQALAASHDLLVRESWHGASLREIISSQLGTYIEGDSGQVALNGPEVELKPEAAQNLGLALHELVINAAKFGALSIPGGRVSIDWGHADSGETNAIEIDWCEQFGPKVIPRRKRGFGSLVIERNLARALDAEVILDFDRDGVRCRIVIPARQVVTAR